MFNPFMALKIYFTPFYIHYVVKVKMGKGVYCCYEVKKIEEKKPFYVEDT